MYNSCAICIHTFLLTFGKKLSLIVSLQFEVASILMDEAPAGDVLWYFNIPRSRIQKGVLLSVLYKTGSVFFLRGQYSFSIHEAFSVSLLGRMGYSPLGLGAYEGPQMLARES